MKGLTIVRMLGFAYFAFLSVFSAKVVAADYDIQEMLSTWLEDHRPCLDSYSRFPVTVDKRFLPRYQPVLDEFVKLGYLSSEETTTNINHDPAKPKKIVKAIRYTATNKGTGHPDDYFKCYGIYKVKSLGKTDAIAHSGKEIRVISFTYELSDIPGWVHESDRFIQLSDDLYDDLHTLNVPGEGQAIIKKGKDGTWRLVKVNRRYEKVSQDPSTKRNMELREKEEESSYQSLLEDEGQLTLEEKIERYYAFMRRFPQSEHHDSIHEKYLNAQKKSREKSRAERSNIQAIFSDLVRNFAAAIDNREQSAIDAITIEKTAARKALKNRLFKRHLIGAVAIKSYKIRGKDNELVQIQVEGGLRMVRAKRIDDKWYVSGYSAMSNKWFKKRDS